ncbi:MAG: sensor histidine kinase [Chitinophagaceae bacterium]|nr:MAG: sensor histidine kinase [Chitinophagaceae bacterium]
MKIRNKILVYFSTTVIVLTAISFTIIYFLFSDYREEEFLQQQNERIITTLQLLTEVKQDDEDIQETMDILTVYDFYDEKLLIFNEKKELIYISKEDIPSPDIENILSQLSPQNEWYKSKEGKYDIIGTHTVKNGKSYYAISKAYDDFGFTKMFFLRNVLAGIFLFIVITVIFVSQFLSNKLSKPITALTEELNNYEPGSEPSKLILETSSYEIRQLTERFNELLKRTNEAFSFQKHTIHHISHQLKTPIAVIVSELEKIMQSDTIEDARPAIQNQIIKAKSLGNIIHVLLEISKIESGQEIQMQKVRVDEIIFDVIEELNIIFPDFRFEINYIPEDFNESKLLLNLNQILIRQAFQNLLYNCTTYSNNAKAEIKIDCLSESELKIQIINQGSPISEEEEKLLFNYFFRGKNSKDKTGFGLGLVLTRKIMELNKASISYHNPDENVNVFELRFRV